jgi:hypothetical protein
MQGLPKTQRSAVKRTCWTLGCGGAGALGTMTITHGPSAPTVIVLGIAAAAVAGNAIAGLCAALPSIIAALSARKVARIKARSDAEVAREESRRRSALVKAGLEGKLDAALCLLKLQVIDAQVRTGRRFSENMLRELLPNPRAPHEEDPKLAVIQPHKSGPTARHAKDDTQPISSIPHS